MSSLVMGSLGGTPSMTQPTPLPWDSPKVVTRNECPNVFPLALTRRFSCLLRWLKPLCTGMVARTFGLSICSADGAVRFIKRYLRLALTRVLWLLYDTLTRAVLMCWENVILCKQ